MQYGRKKVEVLFLERRARRTRVDPNSLGILKVVKTCKICQSPFIQDITADILNDQKYWDICNKYNQKAQEQNVMNPRLGKLFRITPTNVFAHKKHCDPSPIARGDIKRQLMAGEKYGETARLLYQLKYDKEFSKLEALLALYQGRIDNIKFLEAEKVSATKRLKQIRRQVKIAKGQNGRVDLHLIPPQELNTLQEIVGLIDKIENIHSGLTGDLLQHLKFDKHIGDNRTTNIHIDARTLTVAFGQYMTGVMQAVTDIFPGEMERQRQLALRIGELMDQHVGPIIGSQNGIG